jgi:lipooligosaccharide transport system permease protein
MPGTTPSTVPQAHAGRTAVPRHPPRGARPGAGWVRALEYWLINYRRTWMSSAVSAFLAPLLYLGAMGFGLGTMVQDRAGGIPYAQFVAPALLTAIAMQTGIGESTFTVMAAVKWQRQYHAMLATPLTVIDVLLGHLAFTTLRIAMAVVAFLGTGVLLGAFTHWQVLAAVPVAVLCGVAHATPTMAYAIRQEDASGFNLLFRFVMMPMFLFAGTFFPVDQLPAAMRPLAWATPLWHATEVCRGLALGVFDPLVQFAHVAYLLPWAVVGLWLSVRSYTRRLAI